MANWLTTTFGAIAGIPEIVAGFTSVPKDWAKIAQGVALLVLGLVAKDFNKTGHGNETIK